MGRFRLLLTAAAIAALTLVPASAASAHGGKAIKPRSADDRAAAVTQTPILASDNVHLLANFPDTQMISGVHARTGNLFISSSLDSISTYDTSNPTLPVLEDTLLIANFENEAMTYGEKRKANGELVRFVLVGVDLYSVPADDDPQHVNVGGGKLLVIDVSDPSNIFIRGSSPNSGTGKITTSTHTVTCSNVLRCEWGYSAGTRGVVSIIDLRDLTRPRQVATIKSPANGPNPIFRSGAGHRWDIDEAGYAFHTGSGGGALFYIRNRQRNPQLVNATNVRGVESPYNDFILHNSQRPNAKLFQPNAKPSVFKGNVLLITEEDYANEGDELLCNQAGTIQTWYVPTLNKTGVSDTVPSTGNIKPLDIANIPNESKAVVNPPAGAFCSAHWFDFHQSGILAQGYYQQGLRFVDVRDPRNIKEYGYFTGGASEVWDAYWVPRRNASGVATGRKTNIVYTADLVRGMDVFCVELPGQRSCPTLPIETDRSRSTSMTLAATLPLLGLAAILGAARRVRRRLDGVVTRS